MKKSIAILLLALYACEITPTFTAEEDFTTMINQARGKEQPLYVSKKLQAAAEIQSTYMDTANYYGHVWKDGTTLKDRLKMVNFIYGSASENIAKGYKTESEVLQGWLDSPPHCEAIMFKYYTCYGLSHKGIYWTLVLGYE